MDNVEKEAKDKALADREAEVQRQIEEAEAQFAAAMEEDEDEEEQQSGLGFFDRLGAMADEFTTEFTKNFVDYGPPYYPQEEVYSLINECADMKLQVFTIHGLLNQRFDPNLRDPEDLYYTAGHWAARNAHLVAVRMLRRAGANFDLCNEFGQTVLHMATIIKQPPNKIKTQYKLCNYLIDECNVMVNVRDKGGYCALDYACMNNDYEIIKILLKAGADVWRENDILVAKRRELLDQVTDPDCYRLIQLAQKKYEEEYLKKRHEARSKRRKEQRMNRAKQREEEQIQRKIQEFQDKKAAEQLAYQEKIKNDRDERIRKSMNTLTNPLELKRYGEYRRNAKNGKWTWFDKKTMVKSQEVYGKARDRMKVLRDKNKYGIYNSRWEQETDGGKLEMEWKMSTAFDLDTLSDEEVVEDIDEEKSEYNENDEALQGMDLDDMVF